MIEYSAMKTLATKNHRQDYHSYWGAIQCHAKQHAHRRLGKTLEWFLCMASVQCKHCYNLHGMQNVVSFKNEAHFS